MAKNRRDKKARRQNQPGKRVQKNAKYTAGEIAMAVLGGAILIMVIGIIVTSIL